MKKTKTPKSIRLNYILILFVVVTLSCNSKNQNISSVDDSKNSFLSYQSISGSVNGRWKKVNNPYRIINDIYIESGDTLIIDTGVQISNCGTIHIDHNATFAYSDQNGTRFRFQVGTFFGAERRLFSNVAKVPTWCLFSGVI